MFSFTRQSKTLLRVYQSFSSAFSAFLQVYFLYILADQDMVAWLTQPRTNEYTKPWPIQALRFTNLRPIKAVYYENKGQGYVNVDFSKGSFCDKRNLYNNCRT